jgi:NAD+ synthase (glutamine-hydrolysing)
MTPLRIALAQIDGVVGDLAGNAAHVAAYIERARRAGADLVVFPQLALSGYPPGDLLLRAAFLDANRSALPGLLEHTGGITAIIGAVGFAAGAGEVPGGIQNAVAGTTAPVASPTGTAAQIYNGAAVLHAGKLIGFSPQERLSARAPLDETRYFQPRRDGNLYQIAGQWVGITIGDELAPPGAAVTRLVEAGAELIINLAAAPFQQGEWRHRQQELAGVAREFGVTIAYVNRVGGQDEFVFAGGSMIFSSAGEILVEAQPFQEELLLCDLPPAVPRRGSASSGAPGERAASEADAPEAGSGEPGPARSYPSERYLLPRPLTLPRPPLPASAPVEHDDLAETYQALVVGIREYARKNGFKHLGLGLSGGLDSALVATLAVDALGPHAVTAVWMPSPYSSELSRSDAFALAGALGIELLTIPIETAFDTVLQLLQPHFGDRGPDLTEENLQARIRGTLLMGLSNKFGWLVLTTSNKSEVAVGYSTLYGDMAGGLAPLKDLYKTLVFDLARWRNTQAPVIPVSTIERPPTAELRPDQLDTDSLPGYDLLDTILKQYLEEGRSARQIIAGGADPAMVQRLIGLVSRGEYKRRQAAPGIKITAYTFGVDDRMPMTSRFREV